MTLWAFANLSTPLTNIGVFEGLLPTAAFDGCYIEYRDAYIDAEHLPPGEFLGFQAGFTEEISGSIAISTILPVLDFRSRAYLDAIIPKSSLLATAIPCDIGSGFFVTSPMTIFKAESRPFISIESIFQKMSAHGIREVVAYRSILNNPMQNFRATGITGILGEPTWEPPCQTANLISTSIYSFLESNIRISKFAAQEKQATHDNSLVIKYETQEKDISATQTIIDSEEILSWTN